MSIEAYIKQKQITLARSIAGRKKVYLDLNFWIFARDAALGVSGNAAASELLGLLRRGVAEKLLICPVSDSVFFELMKQKNREDRRVATTLLIDELSLGVSLISPDLRIGTEIMRFMYKFERPEVDIYPIQELAWTKVGYVLGHLYPFVPELNATLMLELQRGIIDRLWYTPLTDMIQMIGNLPDRNGPYDALSRKINRRRDIHANEIRSFERAYEIESAGVLDSISHIIANVIAGMAERSGGTSWQKTENMCKNLLIRALKKPDLRKALPTLHIEASLHAAVRMDKPRRFKANDFHDFRHASAALGYYDYFFTEEPLRELVSRKQLDLQAVNKCCVTSNIQKATKALQELFGK